MQAVAEKPGKLVLHPGWIAFAAIALAVPMGALLLRQSVAPDLPMLGELPAFSLVAEDGKPFAKEDLLGKVWIADFVFTSCSDACPRSEEHTSELQSHSDLVCRLLLEKKKRNSRIITYTSVIT